MPWSSSLLSFSSEDEKVKDLPYITRCEKKEKEKAGVLDA